MGEVKEVYIWDDNEKPHCPHSPRLCWKWATTFHLKLVVSVPNCRRKTVHLSNTPHVREGKGFANITLPWQIMRTSEQEVLHRWLTTHKALGLSAPMEVYPALGETTKWAPCFLIPDGEIHSAKNYIGTASHTDSECLLSTACFWAPSISGSFQLVKSSCKSKGLCTLVRKHIKSFPILQLPHLLPTTTMNKKACMSSESLSINHSIWQKAHWTTPS